MLFVKGTMSSRLYPGDPNPLTDYGFLQAKYFFAAYCRTPPVPIVIIECVSYSIVFIEQ